MFERTDIRNSILECSPCQSDHGVQCDAEAEDEVCSEGHFEFLSEKNENPSPCWTGLLIGYLVSSVITSASTISSTGESTVTGVKVSAAQAPIAAPNTAL